MKTIAITPSSGGFSTSGDLMQDVLTDSSAARGNILLMPREVYTWREHTHQSLIIY